MKKHTTNCIRCWKEISISFDPPVKQINSLEIEYCSGPPKTKWRALVIDDDVKILSTINRMLERLHFEVTTTTSEKQTMELLKSEKIFDLVICDLFLGTDDGLKLLYEISRQRPSVKTILMSGSKLTDEEIYCISIDDFLSKPFDLSEVRDTVQKVMDMEV